MIATDYEFYGCQLRSQLPLALIPPCTHPKPEPDIHLRVGTVPTSLQDVISSTPFLSVASNGSALVQVTDAARFLVSSGSEITVQLGPGALLSEVETFLLSGVAGLILHQRKLLPLHGSCVEWNGSALVFAGPCGRGKSTLARAFMQRGATLLSDDISVIQFGPAGPTVSQGSCGIRLWPDMQEHLKEPGENWIPVRSGHRKSVTTSFTKCHGAHPLAAVIRLAPSTSHSPGIKRLHGPSAVMPLSEIVYRAALGRTLGQGEELFRSMMRLAATTPIFELYRPDGLHHLDEVIGWITGALEVSSCSRHALAG